MESGSESAPGGTRQGATEAPAAAPGTAQRQSGSATSLPGAPAAVPSVIRAATDRAAAAASTAGDATAPRGETVSASPVARTASTAPAAPALTVVRPLQPAAQGDSPTMPTLLRTVEPVALNRQSEGEEGPPTGGDVSRAGALPTNMGSAPAVNRLADADADSGHGGEAPAPTIVVPSRGSVTNPSAVLAFRETAAPLRSPVAGPGTSPLSRSPDATWQPGRLGSGATAARAQPRQGARATAAPVLSRTSAPTIFRTTALRSNGEASGLHAPLIERLAAPDGQADISHPGSPDDPMDLAPVAPALVPAPRRTLARSITAASGGSVSTTLRRVPAGQEAGMEDQVEFPSRNREAMMPLSMPMQRTASTRSERNPGSQVQRTPGLDLAAGPADGAAGAEVQRAEATGSVVSTNNTSSEKEEEFNIDKYLPKIADAVWQEFRRRLRSERERARGRL